LDVACPLERNMTVGKTAFFKAIPKEGKAEVPFPESLPTVGRTAPSFLKVELVAFYSTLYHNQPKYS
jgi:hypothetical protein